ncbi:MAG: hypothetical protein HUU35_16215 [Armatimonadetes bacterium]|nr:hypothetical protein [Armatimonadota bacterium]
MHGPERRVVCRHFRQKTMYLGGAEPDLARFNADSAAHCWCLHTQQAFGPDDRRVDPADCLTERPCFEPW